uniref:Ovule protein n=1 Tax=Haemonchus contortus TaxID=6289 RepID=A0A7I4Z4K8_HAECO
MEAMNEAIRQQLSSLLASLDPNTSTNFKALIHETILDQCGLLQKREEDHDCGEYSDEDSFFQEEVRLRKVEVQDESLRLFTEKWVIGDHSDHTYEKSEAPLQGEKVQNSLVGAAYKERLKSIALVIGASGGWFPDEEE